MLQMYVNPATGLRDRGSGASQLSALRLKVVSIDKSYVFLAVGALAPVSRYFSEWRFQLSDLAAHSSVAWLWEAAQLSNSRRLSSGPQGDDDIDWVLASQWRLICLPPLPFALNKTRRGVYSFSVQ
jgi:hypothetical protein